MLLGSDCICYPLFIATGTKPRERQVLYWDHTASSAQLGPEPARVPRCDPACAELHQPAAGSGRSDPSEGTFHQQNQTEPQAHRRAHDLTEPRAKSHLERFLQLFFPLPLISKEKTPLLSKAPNVCAPSRAAASPHCRLLHKQFPCTASCRGQPLLGVCPAASGSLATCSLRRLTLLTSTPATPCGRERFAWLSLSERAGTGTAAAGRAAADSRIPLPATAP